MTIDTLIEHLKDAKSQIGGDCEVRFAQQPSWPFEYSIADCIVVDDDVRKNYETKAAIEEGIPMEDWEEWTHGRDFGYGDDCAYLVEGRQIGYLDEVAREEMGW